MPSGLKRILTAEVTNAKPKGSAVKSAIGKKFGPDLSAAAKQKKVSTSIGKKKN